MVGLREVLGLAGWLFGATLGWLAWGLPGAVVGAIVAALVVALPFEVHDDWCRRQRRMQLQPCFGEYSAPARRDDWARTRQRLKPGDRVRGVVVRAGRPHIFVDIGCGFPAYMVAVPVPDGRKGSADSSRGATGRSLPGLGDEVEAEVVGFVEREREIEIAPGGRWLLLDGEIVGLFAYAEQPIEGRHYLRPGHSQAYAAFSRLPNSALKSRCEVLTGGERFRADVGREGGLGYVFVSIRLIGQRLDPTGGEHRA